MPTLEEGCRLINEAHDFKNIAAAFALLFYVGEREVLLYDELTTTLDEFPSQPSVVDWYDLARLWDRAGNDVRQALNLDPDMAKALDDARKITRSDVKAALEKLGEDFLKKHLPDMRVSASKIKKLAHEKQQCDDTAFELCKKRNAWVNAEISNGLQKNTEFARLMHEKLQLLQAQVSYTDTRVKRLDMAIGQIRSDISSRAWEQSKIQFSQMDASLAKSRQLQEQIEAIKKKAHEAVTTALKDASGISGEEAAAWVERNVFIADNARRKLNRIGYSPEKLKRDMAELYRYLGGKIGPVQLVLEGSSRRAFARGRGVIAVQGKFDKRTLFHECGHLAEAWDPVFQASCQAFIGDRATGQPVSLRKLTGANYRADEMAYPDAFINPYVGKDYGGRASEVFSMALEKLEGSDSLLPLLADAEHFSLLTGFCLRKNPRTARLAKDSLASITQRTTSKKDNRKMWMKALDKVATPELGKRLDERGGMFHGLQFVESNRRTAYLARDGGVTPYGFTQKIMVYHRRATMAALRKLAYLLIANERGLLPEKYTGEDAEETLAAFVFEDRVPPWYSPELELPGIL